MRCSSGTTSPIQLIMTFPRLHRIVQGTPTPSLRCNAHLCYHQLWPYIQTHAGLYIHIYIIHYMCIYTNVYMCMYIYIHTLVLCVYTCVFVRVYAHACECVCVCMRAVCAFSCIYFCIIYIYMHAWLCACACECLCAHARAHRRCLFRTRLPSEDTGLEHLNATAKYMPCALKQDPMQVKILNPKL